MALSPAQAAQNRRGGITETDIHIEADVQLIGGRVLENLSQLDRCGWTGGKLFDPRDESMRCVRFSKSIGLRGYELHEDDAADRESMKAYESKSPLKSLKQEILS